jgi:hypothetical protein
MSNNLTALAARRAHLIEQCAAQRGYLAAELDALRSPLSLDSLRARLAGNNKLVLGAAGLALGLAIMRPKRLMALAGRGLALFGTVRQLLPMLTR